MKDYVKLILELIGLVKAIFKEYKKTKDIGKRKNIIKAVEQHDSEDFRELIFGKK